MQPNWLIFAAVGALIGYLIPYFVKFISFTIRRLKRNIIKGDWFVYHPTNRENEFIIESSKFNIRSGYYNPYVIREYKNNNTGRLLCSIYQFKKSKKTYSNENDSEYF